MRAFILGTLAALSLMPFASTAPSIHRHSIDEPPPPPPDQVWSIDAGNGRIRTWVVWKDEGMTGESRYYCEKRCRGKKHLLHSQCDDSCDGACTEIHKFDVAPDFYLLTDASGTHLEPITKDFQKFGAGHLNGDSVEWAVRDMIQKSIDKNAAKLTAKIDWKHWFDGSCGGQGRNLKGHKYTGVLHYQMFREVEGPDGKIIQTNGPSGSLDAYQLIIYSDQYEQQAAYVQCRCSVVSDEKEHSYVSPPQDTQTGVAVVTPTGNVQATDQLLEQCGFEATCQNMNNCTFTASNPTDKPMTLCVNPGTILECQDDTHQNMVCVSTVKMVLPPPPPPVFASISIPQVSAPKVTVRGEVACINMHKKQPDPSVKFKVGLPSNSAYQRIAAFQSKQRIQGPWDQARMWIFTDKSSYADIQEVMLPAPNKGSYGRALYQLEKNCRVDLSGKEYDKCFDPALLGGTTLYPEMTDWLVDEMAQRDPGKLAKWVQGSAADFAEALAKPDKLMYEHFAALAKALASSSNDSVRNSAADFLLKVVPAEHRTKVAEAGGCFGAMSWLSEKDTGRAKLALDIYEAYKPTKGLMYLLTPNPELPADIKSRAAALAKG